MNKKVLAVIVVVILLLLGGWYFMSSKKGPATTSTETATGTSQPSAVSSIRDLIAKGTAQSCTYSNEGMDVSVYISGGKIREDFDVSVDDKTMKSHVIVMDNNIYSWRDGTKTGIKMSYDPNATPAAVAGSPATSGSFDANASVNYKCSAWVTDNSKFTLPSDITFSTFEVPSEGTSTGASSSQCSYCENLSGDSKTQCLTALKCK